ncbi:uncharacterized protein APUU_71267S [Aspergillus puulaauensis]|nr:uncharacterized protein APUU_61478S [Aspergillus puulaauensis]XP_041561883.1 uncharacterized protein APUU_71267S [Aspergillus puulaauensis]BCS28430.1 hypothetical protein APUU_61478S [Aspergillus puulaauensis]BCS29697.1 hypothetical protein APUU_71267S [Aspergillus puulaauensis]
MIYQQSFEAIHQILGKDQARAWKQTLKTSFLQSHWLLPYPHGHGFMRKSKDTGQEPGKLLPAEYIQHHPTTSWGHFYPDHRYMERGMEPEMDLVRLSDGDLYEKLVQIADRFSQNP